MRIVLQRVTRAEVEVNGEIVGSIGRGLCLFVGVALGDGSSEVSAAVKKIAGLRVFADDQGKMNRSVVDVAGAVLVVSQFTLLGDVSRGRRPSFTDAAPPEAARMVIDEMVSAFENRGLATSSGEFGAMMRVDLSNDGPVTLVLEFSNDR